MANLDRLEAFYCNHIRDHGLLEELANKCEIKCLGFRYAIIWTLPNCHSHVSGSSYTGWRPSFKHSGA